MQKTWNFSKFSSLKFVASVSVHTNLACLPLLLHVEINLRKTYDYCSVDSSGFIALFLTLDQK